MALYITCSDGNHIEWHVGEDIPNNLPKVVEFQADGDELDRIYSAMTKTHMISPAIRNQFNESLDRIVISKNLVLSFQVGDVVRWTSQSQGYTKTKEGVIIEVVPANYLPANYFGNRWGGARNHESYVIKVGSQLYWPKTSYLTLVQSGNAGMAKAANVVDLKSAGI